MLAVNNKCPTIINIGDVPNIKAKLIAEGSNIPIKPEVEEALYRKGILVVPDIVANAGGVISSYVEHKKGTEDEMFKMIKKKINKNTKVVLDESEKRKLKPRDTAMEIAKERVVEQCKICGKM